MTWSPNLENVIQRIPQHRLLKKAVKKVFDRTGQFPAETYRDEHGVFGYRYRQYIICAKEEIYGNIVSCHKKLIFEGMYHRIPIVMWIDKSGAFYAFDPEELFEDSHENMKGKAQMMNFDIKLGKAVKL